MTHKCYLLSRPSANGTHSSNCQEQIAWTPTQPIPPSELELYSRYVHGCVVYDQPRSFKQIREYDQEPGTKTMLTTWLAYRYWLDASRNVKDAQWLIEDIWNTPSDQFGENSLDEVLDGTFFKYKEASGTLEMLWEVLHVSSH